jgi:hydroxypyruvate reductase
VKQNPVDILSHLFKTVLVAADPSVAISHYLPDPPPGRTVVVGAGKAAARMARAFEASWNGRFEGIVVTQYGHAVPCERITVLEASHPVPDGMSVRAAEAILQAVSSLNKDDLVLCLISGGASALMAAPVPGVSLADKQAVNVALLASGARIQDINAVRKHLSAVKGGRLAQAAYPSRVVSLIVSDVVGDDISAIGSGPTAPDPSTFDDAREVIRKYGIGLPDTVVRHLTAGEQETPKAGDPVFHGVRNIIVCSPSLALHAAVHAAESAGIDVIYLGDAIEGEANAVGREHALRLLDIASNRGLCARPTILMSGGELTVTLDCDGRGGPNQEYILAAAIALGRRSGYYGLAADTDGADGPTDAAGAFIHPDTLRRARELSLDPADFLRRHDSHRFFCALGHVLRTGPTHTNVNDFRALAFFPSS